MKMLEVTIRNIDCCYTWLFDHEAIHALDFMKVHDLKWIADCVRKAVDNLISRKGFFQDNQIYQTISRSYRRSEIENTTTSVLYGILHMPMNNPKKCWETITRMRFM